MDAKFNNQILQDYKITITSSRMARRLKPMPLSYSNMIRDFSARRPIDEEIIKVLTLDIPQEELEEMTTTLGEFRDMMRDPETAKLLMEAKFIHRLKGGRRYGREV